MTDGFQDDFFEQTRHKMMTNMGSNLFENLEEGKFKLFKLNNILR